MASTAWTATRDELVRELAKARAMQQIAESKLRAYRANRHRITDQSRERARAKDVARAIQELANASRLIETIPPDPNAAQHRADLLAALKEKN